MNSVQEMRAAAGLCEDLQPSHHRSGRAALGSISRAGSYPSSPFFPIFLSFSHVYMKLSYTNLWSLHTLDRELKVVDILPGKSPCGQHWMLDLLDRHRQRPEDCPLLLIPQHSATTSSCVPLLLSSEWLWFASAVAPWCCSLLLCGIDFKGR